MGTSEISIKDVPISVLLDIAKQIAQGIVTENLLVFSFLCVLLSSLAIILFWNTPLHRIRLVAFVTTTVFFSGIAVATVLSTTNSLHRQSDEDVFLPKQEAEEEVGVQPDAEIIATVGNIVGLEGTAVGPLPEIYGRFIVMNSPPFQEKANAATFKVTSTTGGIYSLQIRLAAASSRPVNVSVNDRELVLENVAGEPTGGWGLEYQRYQEAGQVTLEPGPNLVRLSSDSVFPHIEALKFTLVP